jgi:hypothetical protein
MPNINVFRGSDCPVPDGVCNPVRNVKRRGVCAGRGLQPRP